MGFSASYCRYAKIYSYRHYTKFINIIRLAMVGDFRKIDWNSEYPYPTLALKDIKSLLVYV